MTNETANPPHQTPPKPLSFQEPLHLAYDSAPAFAPQSPEPAPGAPDFTVLTLMTAGRAAHTVQGYSAPIGKDSVLLALPQSSHVYRDATGIGCLSLYIHADWLFEALRPLWSEVGLVRILIAERLFPVCREVIGTMVFEPTTAEAAFLHEELASIGGRTPIRTDSLTLQTGALLKMLAVLNECLEREDQGARLPLLPAVWRVADAVEGAVAQGLPIDIGELATSVGMPQARFARMFRDATGIAPREYIQQRRVQYGARMLIEDMDTVTEIALRLGFSDAAHFCRVFKRDRGMTPNEYRHRFAEPPPKG